MVKEVYYVREPGIDGEWYSVVMILNGKMSLLPHVYKKWRAEEIVADMKDKMGIK